jgi:hypothetical protein
VVRLGWPPVGAENGPATLTSPSTICTGNVGSGSGDGLSTAADAYRHLESGEATGKVVIDITRSGSMSEVFLRSGRLPTTVITEEGTW